MNENCIWSDYGTVLKVIPQALIPQASDVMGATITVKGDSRYGGFSTVLTVAEALLLAEMLTSSVREVIREVGL